MERIGNIMEQLSNIGTIKKLLSKHGFTFSKSLGQNFLINPTVCPRMAEKSGASENTGVIEIGPGIGVLTKELAKRSKKVVSFELDKKLIPVLEETLKNYDNIKIINEDILKVNLHKVIKEEFKDMDVVVCANLPYYITSPIIMKLLEENLPINSITVMVQKEAAQRICAEVGSRESGALTVAINYYSDPEMLFNVSAGSFLPAPKVESSVIKLNVLKEPKVDVIEPKVFFRVVKALFGQRRKTITNSLSNGLGIEKDSIREVLKKASLQENLRAEQLKIEEVGKIANIIKEKNLL